MYDDLFVLAFFIISIGIAYGLAEVVMREINPIKGILGVGAALTLVTVSIVSISVSQTDKSLKELLVVEFDEIDDVIRHGIKYVGMYHAKRPLMRTKDGNITSEDLTLLYYYHNRLNGYGLDNFV